MKESSVPWRHLIFLLWISYLLTSGLLLFIDGFFLTREARPERSECISCTDHGTCDPKSIFEDPEKAAAICLRPRARVVLLVVDALKYEFLEWRESVDSESTYHLNKMPLVSALLREHPERTRLYKFIADPPTTTMQRLKGLTTGGLPTFVEIGSNFAADRIDEDNIIEQTSKRGGVVFMGDDTWTSLYPKKFIRQFPSPSFNVWDLDTVDREVSYRMAFELKKNDWSLLVAHILGVDHCGHKHGMHHPEMRRKLSETDRLIKDIVYAMNNDTILLVVGDHGMTRSGDHGGDSQDEVEAGMFVYSKMSLASGAKDSSRVVNQIDLVPTISALLGIPVPFSNIGSVVLECFPRSGKNNELWFGAHAIWSNVVQTKNYIDAYSRHTFLFGDEKLKELEELFLILAKDVKNIRDTESFENFSRKSMGYLKVIHNLCKEVWVQFNAGSMSKGLVLLFCTLLFLYIFVNGITDVRINGIMESRFLHFVIITNIVTSIIVYSLYSMSVIEEFKNSNFFATGAASIVLFVILIVQNWDSISAAWHNSFKREKVNYYEGGILLLLICSAFSNSYVIEEDKCLSFLLVTTIAWLVYSAIDKDNVIADNHERVSKNEKHLLDARKSQSILILIGFVACIFIKLSSYFWRCREEQDREACTNFIGKSVSLESQGTERILLAGSTIILALYVTTVRIWLSHGGNLSGLSPSAIIARYFPSVMVVCIGGYWVLQTMPKDGKAQFVVPWQANALPRIVYSFALLGVFVLYLKPLCSCLDPRKSQFTDFQLGGDVILKLFKRVKELFYPKTSIEHPDMVVSGLGTVYSATFISMSVFLVLVWSLLLGNVSAPGTFMMSVAATAVLGIVAIERIRIANNVDELLQVPTSAVLCWFLIAEYFFYGTGHQPTFPTINWDAAFIGTGGRFYSHFLSAVLIGIHTFGGHLVMAMTLPLLPIVPLTASTMIPELAKLKFRVNDDDMRNGELIIFKHNSTFHNALLSVYGKYILLHGLRTFGCMLTTTIHCRHLMVWKIFAPKLIFQGLSFLVSLGSVLASALIVQRIHRKVDDLRKGLGSKST